MQNNPLVKRIVTISLNFSSEQLVDGNIVIIGKLHAKDDVRLYLSALPPA